MEEQLPIRVFNTQRSMNKPVYFLGLTGMEMVILFLGVLFFWFLLKVWTILFAATALQVYRLRYREWRKGNPNVFVSWRVWVSTPGKIVDKGKILEKL